MPFPFLAAALGIGALAKGVGQFAQASQSRSQAAARQNEANADALDAAREGRGAVAFGRTAIGASGLTQDGSALSALSFLAAKEDSNVRRVRYRGEREASQLRDQGRAHQVTGLSTFAVGAFKARGQFEEARQ